MKFTFFKYIIAVFALVMVTSACEREYLDPSSTPELEAVKDANGLIALCNGLAYRYSISRVGVLYNVVVADALTTKQVKILNTGNTGEDNLAQGNDKVLGNNNLVTNIWEQSNLVRSAAQLILDNAGNAGDPATNAGIVAYASLFKAMALGNLATFWQQAPVTLGEEARFNTRNEVLQEAVKTLESALAILAANATAPGSTFTAKIVPGIDIVNTCNALLARYANMLGDNDKAFDAAGKVNLTKKSEFRHDEVARNAIFDVAFSNTNVVQPFDTLMGLPAGLQPNTADGRILFYLQNKLVTGGLTRGKGFFTANNAPVPLYLPGEMLLIRAEAMARKGMLTEAVAELDKVLTKTTDAFGIGAKLPAYAGAVDKDAILTEIYRNRCIELFMSGLKLEDSRRFGRAAGPTNLVERNRDWYPYPNNERDNNPSTPVNPTF